MEEVQEDKDERDECGLVIGRRKGNLQREAGDVKILHDNL